MTVQAEPLMAREKVADGCCATSNDIVIDSVHSLLLKIGGAFCIIFGVIELGLGGTAYTYLDGLKLGAWWCGILTIVAGSFAAAARKRGFVIVACVLASISIAITLSGAVVDGVSSRFFQDFTACSSTDSKTLLSYNYGLKDDYAYADKCQESFAFKADACYCVQSGGGYCREYSLSAFAKKNQQNCGNILGNYANTLSASTAFCVACLVMVFFMAILTCTLLCCPQRSPMVYGRKLTSADGIEVGITGEGHA